MRSPFSQDNIAESHPSPEITACNNSGMLKCLLQRVAEGTTADKTFFTRNETTSAQVSVRCWSSVSTKSKSCTFAKSQSQQILKGDYPSSHFHLVLVLALSLACHHTIDSLNNLTLMSFAHPLCLIFTCVTISRAICSQQGFVRLSNNHNVMSHTGCSLGAKTVQEHHFSFLVLCMVPPRDSHWRIQLRVATVYLGSLVYHVCDLLHHQKP